MIRTLKLHILTILKINNKEIRFEHFELKSCVCPFKRTGWSWPFLEDFNLLEKKSSVSTDRKKFILKG